MKMIRSLATCLPHPLLCRLYHHVHLRQESTRATRVAALAGLPLLQTLDLRSVKVSETLFVLGSAWSINDISDKKWDIIGRHDSIGINFWPAHSFVPRLFHFEDIAYDSQPVMYDAFRLLLERRSKAYANSLKIVTGVNSIGPRQMVFELPDDIKKNFYVGFSMPVIARNEEELRAGVLYMDSIGAFSPRPKIAWLFKYGGSVIAAMTLAVLMGYKRIILCGVDLNKQDYFYQHRERYPECAGWEFVPRTEMHLTTRKLPWLVPAQSAVCIFKELILDPEGIELLVESPVSTLYPRVPLASDLVFEELARQRTPLRHVTTATAPAEVTPGISV